MTCNLGDQDYTNYYLPQANTMVTIDALRPVISSENKHFNSVAIVEYQQSPVPGIEREFSILEPDCRGNDTTSHKTEDARQL